MLANHFVECFVILDAVYDVFLVITFSLPHSLVEFARGFRGAAISAVPMEEMLLVCLLALRCLLGGWVAFSPIWLPYHLDRGAKDFS